ncbi:MAG: PEP-utilizing enzyme [Patescibacteria group bacterium]|jgi:phosphoenolpyruvate synthase/pyruvate phosphate dikinase
MAKEKTSQDVWMTAAEIPRNTLFMMSEPIKFFVQTWPKLGLGGKVSRYYSYFDGDFCQMKYIRREFDAQADYLSRKMLRQPRWAIQWIARVERWSAIFMHHSKRIVRSDLNKLSNRRLITLFHSSLKFQVRSHGVGASVSWHADAEKERVTKGIWRALENHLQKIGSQYDVVEIFGTLTTPPQTSYVSKEEVSFLRTAAFIAGRKQARSVFLKHSIDRIPEKLRVADRVAYSRVLRHYRSFRWLNYQYKGPATALSEYLGRWQELLKSKSSPVLMLENNLQTRRAVMKRQRTIVRQLRLTPYVKNLIMLAQRMVFIKDFRKDALFYGMHSYDPLLREIGKRVGLTIHQIWAMNTWELAPALLHNKFDIDELNARQKEAVAYADRKRYIVYSGEKAKNFLKNIRHEKTNYSAKKELSGTPACTGKVVGTVKIINLPEEMSKMKAGDVMVAHNTNPNLVPAMKKAGALVSEAGGLTCHTAIVARELQTPCIVGVAGVTHVLKDGDRVEVDATRGVIKKLK